MSILSTVFIDDKGEERGERGVEAKRVEVEYRTGRFCPFM
jgi:hypothetical protein